MAKKEKKEVSIVSREVSNRGRIIVETRLDQGYYNYVTGSEDIALDRVAEALYSITDDKEIPSGGAEINLATMVLVGSEVIAANIPRLLVLDVTGFDARYEQDIEFEKLLTIVGQKATQKLITGGGIRFKIETRY